MRLTLESQLPPLILAVTYMAGYRKSQALNRGDLQLGCVGTTQS